LFAKIIIQLQITDEKLARIMERHSAFLPGKPLVAQEGITGRRRWQNSVVFVSENLECICACVGIAGSMLARKIFYSFRVWNSFRDTVRYIPRAPVIDVKRQRVLG
jgi:hypothetical protein